MALINAMNNAFSAMDGFKQGFDVVSNNISNVNSIGFKSSKMNYLSSFSTILQRSAPANEEVEYGSNTVAMQVGNGMQVDGTVTSFSQGALERTEQETDLAIVGSGFFKVLDTTSNTPYLTRAGNFRKDSRNYLVTYQQGYRLQGTQMDSTHMPAFRVDYDAEKGITFKNIEVNHPKNQGTEDDLRIQFNYAEGDIDATYNDEDNYNSNEKNITGGKLYLSQSAQTAITANTINHADIIAKAPIINSFSFSTTGEIHYIFNDQNSTDVIGGKLILACVDDAQALLYEGDGLYTGMEAAGTSYTSFGITNTYLRSKTLEMANVDITKQFSDMITLQRGFQASARVITISDEILNEVVNLKRS